MTRAYGKLLFAAVLLLFVMLCGTGFSYKQSKVEDGGRVKGKVTYKGTVPTRNVVPTKDTDICGGVRKDPLIIVGPGNGVKDAVVYIRDIEAGRPFDRPETPAVINNKDCRFHPHVQVARKGPIEIRNSDPTLHNTHGFYGKKTAFNVALPIKGMSIKQRLKQSGLVRVECDAHGWMRGWIYVVDNPYYAITREDGSFEIGDVPPGKHTILIWQEDKGIIEREVKIESGKTVTLDIELNK